MKRHRDAVNIVEPGACNPSGILHAMLEAVEEIRRTENWDTETLRNDPALRLMCFQLAHLLRTQTMEPDEYGQLLQKCRSERP